MAGDIHCYMCNHFRCSKNSCLVKHLFEVHSYEPNFTYTCQVDHCPRSFSVGSKYVSFLQHVSRKHPNWKENLDASRPITHGTFIFNLPDSISSDSDPTFNTPASLTTEDLLNDENDFSSQLNSDNESDADAQPEECARLAAGRFLLTLKERYKLSQAAVDFCVGSVKQMIGFTCQDLKLSMQEALEQSNCSELLENLGDNINPFEKLETEHQQTSFYKEHLGLVEPLTIELGTSSVWHKSGSRKKLVEEKDTFQYIPLLETLQSVLQNKAILAEVSKSHARADNLIADLCDGSLFKNHELFKNDPLALQVIAYYDDVEACNPLGSHRGTKKLALFYFTLGNIRPKRRCKLQCIYLIACATYPILQKYGFQKILQPFIDDANKLTEGVRMQIGNEERILRGGVLVWLNDTLAAHSIGGFKVGVGFSLRKCRECLATKESMSSLFTAADFTPRTIESHNYHCSLLDGVLSEYDSITYGVNNRSILNDLSNFHVANGQLPQDIMHVLLEGVLPYEVKLLLQELILKKKYFTLEYLNAQIQAFGYSPEEARDKPPSIKQNSLTDDGRISMKAVEMWVFVIYLPLMVGCHVPEDDPFWECFLLLIDILKISTACIQSVDLAAFLAALISDHHHAFVRCYPNSSVIPKLHYCVHLPSQILRVGPLVTACCLRMEAKHSYFKQIAQSCGFKNISYSVAKRYQRLVCAYHQSDDFFADFKCGPYKDSIPLSAASNTLVLLIKQVIPEIADDSLVYKVKWVHYEGNTYRPIEFVLYDWQQDDMPKFGQINNIYMVESLCLLLVTSYRTVGIDRHFHGYLVESEHDEIPVLLKYLPGHPPVIAHSLNGNLIICLHSHIIKAY